ncbi:sulfatase [Stieleria sp. ICT_E10.1]|uniref:sulfatase n=1 Tax=Stieleria sedimenti TaxID=2976331 RepID=UPI00218051FF|nr:sulfatase [Stieleria sedimenti]MCS7467786.1 sulfatase [Stieleria sedimenti]
MIRTIFILWLTLAITSDAFADDRPNVLFIAADDLRCDLGCYGHPLVKTPHLDRLAARGTRFDRAYCAQALCNPSRSSLLTGRRPNTLAQYNLTKHFRDAIPDVVTLPQYFKQNGYFAQDIGKIFHNWATDIQGDPESWSVPAVMHFDSHRHDVPQVEGQLPRDFAEAIRCECRDVPDDAYFDGRITTLALAALRERAASQQPFFLAVGFWKPHLPFNAPKKYWDLYDRDEITGPDCPQWPVGTPRIAWHNSQELLGKSKPATLSKDDEQELRHGYLAAISYMDAQVGRLLSELDQLGLTEQTLVVFWSDHGFQLGDHTLWCKTSNFELDARVPLIIAPPKAVAVKQTDAIVELLDLYPTIADLCGLDEPSGIEGVSLRPLIDGDAVQVKQAALTQHPRPSYYGNSMKAMGHSIRTPRFRYTEWHSSEDGSPAGGELVGVELYDHDVDPSESVNRADDGDYQKHRSELRAVLNSMAGEPKGQ